MTILQQLQTKNDWWIDNKFRPVESLWPNRTMFQVLLENLAHPLMLNIVGLRRVGKSTLLKQLIGTLLEQGIESKNICYFLFDYASQIKKAEFLDDVISTYLDEILLTRITQLKERIYVFLDEIQYIENWEAILKKYYDLSNKKIKFIVTGSQSILLKGKSKESLAGRIFDKYLPPLSFLEFLNINHEKVQSIDFDLFNLETKFVDISGFDLHHGARIRNLSREYIISGQFPETRQVTPIALRHEYITESVLGKVLEDCIRIYKIEKSDEFKLVAFHLLQNISSVFELKNIGREIALSKVTLEKYLEYLKDSYIVEILYKYHKSLIKQGRLSKKLYTTCVNFTCAFNHYKQEHIEEVPDAFGKIIENLVYNILAQKYQEDKLGHELSFWRQEDKEIDFIVQKEQKQIAIEIKFTSNVNIRKFKVLTDYIQDKNLDYGIVITKDRLEKRKINEQTIYFLPYYLLLLVSNTLVLTAE